MDVSCFLGVFFPSLMSKSFYFIFYFIVKYRDGWLKFYVTAGHFKLFVITLGFVSSINWHVFGGWMIPDTNDVIWKAIKPCRSNDVIMKVNEWIGRHTNRFRATNTFVLRNKFLYKLLQPHPEWWSGVCCCVYSSFVRLFFSVRLAAIRKWQPKWWMD